MMMMLWTPVWTQIQMQTAAKSKPQWTTTLNQLLPCRPSCVISKSHLEVFQLYFTPELLDMIVKETNNYAQQVMGDKKFSKWSKMDVVELKTLLGFKILMAAYHPLMITGSVADRIS